MLVRIFKMTDKRSDWFEKIFLIKNVYKDESVLSLVRCEKKNLIVAKSRKWVFRKDKINFLKRWKLIKTP